VSCHEFSDGDRMPPKYYSPAVPRPAIAGGGVPWAIPIPHTTPMRGSRAGQQQAAAGSTVRKILKSDRS